MSSLDPTTQQWINSLKLNKKLSSTADFENGYNFGIILEKLQLSRGKKFKNSSDLACIFQNYKNVKDLLLENFGYDFPVNNIIYRTEQLLNVLRQQCIKYLDRKKVATLNAATSVINTNSLIRPQEEKLFKNRQKDITSNTLFNQTSKMPRKIQQIQQKLDKFRDQKTRHQLVALEQRKHEMQQYRRLVQNNREYEQNKIRHFHQTTKNHERKVYDVWTKTEQIKKNRIKVDKQFQQFQNAKRDQLQQSLRKQQVDFIEKGLQMFQLNCIRQGVELEHDPDKPYKPQNDNFNKVVVMERIKDNIKKNTHDKKQRIKRQNKKNIDAQEAKLKSEMQWAQIHKLQDYQKKFSKHYELCQATRIREQSKIAEKQVIKNRYKNKQFIELPAASLPPQQQERLDQQLRKRKLQYLYADVDRIEKKWNDRYSISEEIVQALLQVTIQGEQIYDKNQGFSYMQWKDIENRFLNYEVSHKKKGRNSEYFMDYSNFNDLLRQYISGSGSWKNFRHASALQGQELSNSTNQQLIEIVDLLISKSYPDQEAPTSEPVALHMPLKIAFGGDRVVGKSTQSAKISEKFNIPIIDPKQLLKQALELAKPPPEQDPKKAGKKDAKKQELTAQKIALKDFGTNLFQNQKLENYEDATTEQLISVIKFRLNQLYKVLTQEEILSQFTSSKSKEKERHQKALLDFQEAQKKPKKDSKKGGNDAPQQPPTQNPLFYASGFILDNFPITEESLKKLERQMNSYICWDERINKQASQIRNKISLLLPIPQKVEDPKLKSGTFDLLLELKVAEQQMLKNRRTGRKIDPQNKIIYHQQFNPIPDVKGFAQKLVQLPAVEQSDLKSRNREQVQKIQKFYSKFGYQVEKQKSREPIKFNAFHNIIEQNSEPVPQTMNKAVQLISNMLAKKYQGFEQRISQLQAIKQQQAKIQSQTKPDQPISEQAIQKEPQGADDKKQQPQKQPKKQQQQTPNANKQEQAPKNEQQQNNSKQQQQQNQKNQEKNIIQAQNQNKDEKIKYTKLPELINNQISVKVSQQLLQKYIGTVQSYEQSIKQSLYLLEHERQVFTKELLTVQKNFTNIINRLDDRAGKILGFQENYNRLLMEQGSIVKDAEASKHLIQRLDQLYDSLWVSIGGKKDQAIRQRQAFMNSDWLNVQSQKIVQISRKILQTQLNYFCQTIFFILTITCRCLNKPSDYMTEYLSLGISPELECIYSSSPNNLTKNDRLQYYLNQVDRCLETLPHWVQQKHKKMRIFNQVPKPLQDVLKGFIKYWLHEIKQKKQIIANKVSERLLEQRSYFHALINKMDEWIIQGIKSENDFVYQIYKSMKKSIEEARRCTIKQLHVREITEIFGPIKQLTLYPIPLRVYTHHRKLPIFSYMVFLEEVKSLISTIDGRISFDTFKKYLIKRQKSQLLDKQILKCDFDTVEQYLVKDGYMFYRQVAMAVLFWDVNVFDDDALYRYKVKLLGQPYNNNKSGLEESLKSSKSVQAKENAEQSGKKSDNIVENEEKEQKEQQNKEQIQENTQEKYEKEKQAEKAAQVLKEQTTQQKYQMKKRQSIIAQNPVSRHLSLQQLILMEGAFDDEQQYIMKHFIFEIFRENGQSYIEAQTLLDTLSLFDQLQVLKYGDTVMMLGL